VKEQKRKFVESLGNRIAERINWAVVPNATAVAACALLGEGRRGVFREELVNRMREIVEFLRLQDARLTPSLTAVGGDFHEAIGSLIASGLIRSSQDARGEVLYFENNRRTALDLYRNGIVHYLAAPSFLARCLSSDTTLGELRSDLSEWLDLFYYEFFTPRGEVLAAHLDAFVDHFERAGWIERNAGVIRPTGMGVDNFASLSEQTQGFIDVYYATASAVLSMQGPLTPKELIKSAREQLDRAEILGEVAVGRKATSDTTFMNALEQLERYRIIGRAPEASGKDVPFESGEAFEDLAALKERLAFALTAR
jgi:glycerol-3-phosphate O-acyltransferase